MSDRDQLAHPDRVFDPDRVFRLGDRVSQPDGSVYELRGDGWHKIEARP